LTFAPYLLHIDLFRLLLFIFPIRLCVSLPFDK